MLIQTIEKKTRLALTTVVLCVVGCTIICLGIAWKCLSMVDSERSQIYVLDGQIPFLAERAKLEATYSMEAKAHIQLFHQYFFNLPPDDEYIKWTLNKALYMADGTALKQKQAMEERGFYNDLVATGATANIICDSIKLDEGTHEFTYYGTQIIKRRTSGVRRSLVTAGIIENAARTQNNPHGMVITAWRTLENKDL